MIPQVETTRSPIELIQAGEFTGIIGGIPNEVYHKSPGLSFTGLKNFAITPAHYQAYLRQESKREVIGTGTHMAVLEPERFEKLLFVVPNRLGKNKEKADDAAKAGMFAVTEKEYQQIRAMSQAILKNRMARQLLQGGIAEQSVFWRDPATGVLLKCRPDYLRANDGIVVDIKYFGELSNWELERQLFKMKYHWQSGLYLDGVATIIGRPTNLFVHIFVSEDDPYCVRVVTLNDASLEKARFDYQPHIERFAECKRTNIWPGYPEPEEGITELAIPDYAWN